MLTKTMRKANLPYSRNHARNHNGETVWVDFSEKAIIDLKSNIPAMHTGILLNDSMVFPEIKAGQKLVFKFGPDRQPVAMWNQISGKLLKAEFLEVDRFPLHRLPDSMVLKQDKAQAFWEAVANPSSVCACCGEK